MGLAVLYSPFFFIAHWLAPALGYPADGFSLPYQFFQVIGGLIWCILGIFMLRKLLHKYFSDTVVAVTLPAIFIGTNYLGIAAVSTLMPHTYLFTIYTLILWFTWKWHEDKQPGYLIMLGLWIGLAILIRPTEGISILIPLLWGIHDRSSLYEKVKRIWHQIGPFLLSVLLLFLVFLPQMLYWKAYTGKFLYYSYVNPGEGFEFLHPYTINFLFSFRKGWFIYTPVMLFAMYGFYLLYRKKRTIFWALTIFLILNIYILSSWSCWWYAASFGQRAMAQSYPLMAIPLAMVIDHWLKVSPLKKYIGFIIMALLILLNLFQHWQYFFRYVIPSDRMTATYYFKSFGKASVSPKVKKLLLVDRDMPPEEFLKNVIQYRQRFLGGVTFEKPWNNPDYHPEDSVFHSGRLGLCLDSNCIYTPAVHLKYKYVTDKYYAWIKVSVWIYPIYDPKENPINIVLLYTHEGEIYDYQAQRIDKLSSSLKQGTWNKIEFYSITPEVRNVNDYLMAYLWYIGKKPVFTDDFKVEAFEPK
jgi:hypothetical protein